MTEAHGLYCVILRNPCHTDLVLLETNWFSSLRLYLYLAELIAWRTAYLALRNSSLLPLMNAEFFMASSSLMSLVNHGLSLPYTLTNLLS